MSKLNPEEFFEFFINITLCLDVEIMETQSFIQSELEHSLKTELATQSEMLLGLKNYYTTLVETPFLEKIYNQIFEREDDKLLNVMDYMFFYASISPKVFGVMNKSQLLLKSHSLGGHLLSSIHESIEECYPGIAYANPDEFPHETYVKIMRQQGK